MAKTSALGLAMLCAVLVLSPLMVHSNKQFTLYATTIPGVNVILVASRPGPPNPNPIPQFGDISAFDLPVTESLNPGSPVVAHIQGFAAVSSLDGTQVFFSDSLIFKSGKYKFGTLEVQGILRIGVSPQGPVYSGELVVSSGTIDYRFNYGYMDVKTVQQFPERNATVLEIKIFLED